MTDDENIEHLLDVIKGARNMLTGMMFDPNIPDTAKSAMTMKIEELNTIIEEYTE